MPLRESCNLLSVAYVSDGLGERGARAAATPDGAAGACGRGSGSLPGAELGELRIIRGCGPLR